MPNQKPVFPSHTRSPRIPLGPGPSMANPRVLALPAAIAAASPARLTPAAHAHGLALAMPEVADMARPTGARRTVPGTVKRVPIE